MKFWKFLPLLLCGLSAVFSARAQEVMVGPFLVVPQPKDAQIGTAYFADDNSMVVLAMPQFAPRNKYQLTLVDSNFKEVWVAPLGQLTENQHLEDLVIIDGQICLFSREYYPEQKDLVLYYQRFDRKTGKSLTPRQEVLRAGNESKDRPMFVFRKLADGSVLCYNTFTDMRVSFSDRKLALIYCHFMPGQSEPKKGALLLPFNPTDFSLRSVKFAPNGDLYVLAVVANQFHKYDGVMSGLKKNVNLLLFRHQPLTQKTDSIRFEIEELDIQDVFCEVTSQNRVVVGGALTFNGRKAKVDEPEFAYYNGDANALPSLARFQTIQLRNAAGEGFSTLLRASTAPTQILQVTPDGTLFLGAQKGSPPIGDAPGGATTFHTTNTGLSFLLNEAAGLERTTIGVPIADAQDLQSQIFEKRFNYHEAYLIRVGPDSTRNGCFEVPMEQVESMLGKHFFAFAQGQAFNFVYRQMTPKDNATLYLVGVGAGGTVGTPKVLRTGLGSKDHFLPTFCRQVGPNDALLMYYRDVDKSFVIARLTVIPK